MKNSNKIFWLSLTCLCVLFLSTGEAYADDVLQKVREKAASLLISLRPVIFILAGFGLIGFAWMAIFNKISWKWFANIAMGLFLVANMGLFVNYFTTRSGLLSDKIKKVNYSDRLLDTGDHIGQKGGFGAIEGTSSDPKSQEAKSETTDPTAEGGAKENSDSSELDGGQTCVPGTGINCDNKTGGGSGNNETPGDGTGKSGSSEGISNADMKGAGLDNILNNMGVDIPDKLENPLDKNKGSSSGSSSNSGSSSSSSSNTSNVPSGAQMNDLAQKAKEQYDKTGKVDMNQLLRDQIAAGNMTPEQAAQAGGIFTEVANAKGGNVGKAINEVLEGSMEQAKEEYEKEQEKIRQDFLNQPKSGQSTNNSGTQNENVIKPTASMDDVENYVNQGDDKDYDGGMLDEVEITGKAPSKTGAGLDNILNNMGVNIPDKLVNPLDKNKDNNKEESGGVSYFACQKQGGTWDEASGTCKGAKPSTSAAVDDEEEEVKKPIDDDEDDNDSGVSFYACQQKGGTWKGDKCVLPGEDKTESSSDNQAECSAQRVACLKQCERPLSKSDWCASQSNPGYCNPLSINGSPDLNAQARINQEYNTYKQSTQAQYSECYAKCKQEYDSCKGK